jgi:hypothetical protein
MDFCFVFFKPKRGPEAIDADRGGLAVAAARVSELRRRWGGRSAAHGLVRPAAVAAVLRRHRRSGAVGHPPPRPARAPYAPCTSRAKTSARAARVEARAARHLKRAAEAWGCQVPHARCATRAARRCGLASTDRTHEHGGVARYLSSERVERASGGEHRRCCTMRRRPISKS